MIQEWIFEAYTMLGMNLGIIVAIVIILMDRDIDRRLK
jgi:hypothetical protein